MTLPPTFLPLFLASLLRRRLASALSLLAIALGVALGLAVQLIHDAALDEFGRGSRQLAGEADLQVEGGADGFDDALYVELAQRPEISAASPVLTVRAKLPGHSETLEIHGIDIFRAAEVQPRLLPRAAGEGERFAAFEEDALFLSAAARHWLAPLMAQERITVQVGLQTRTLHWRGDVPGAEGGQRWAVMDIAAAQRTFDRIGRLSRIDLRLAPGQDRARAEAALRPLLPAGVQLRSPEAASGELGALSRAYRVNLTMLAAIALLTGGFLVFSTQFLAVSRRRREFALLRALGLVRGELFRGLILEGAMLGALGGLLGVALGYALTALAFRHLGGDLGAGYFRGVVPELRWQGALVLGYLLLGVLAGVAGTLFPARAAARIAPARALHAGESEAALSLQAQPRARWILGLVAAAVAASLLPPANDIPLGGYTAVFAALCAAVLLLPASARRLPALLGTAASVPARLARARLAAAPGQAVVAGAGVVASVALAAAMAIMVSSFRASVDDWLTQVLPADLYVRASGANASGHIDDAALERIAATPGVAAVDAARVVELRLEADRTPVVLMARAVEGGWRLPLVAGSTANAGAMPVAWLSEAVADRYGKRPGDHMVLPLAGADHDFVVGGIWRDYARQQGAIVIERSAYLALTGDSRINDLALRLTPGHDPEAVAGALQAQFGTGALEIALPAELRRITLAVFDRTFLVTYLMEAVAVVIGLFGVATTFAALTTSRRGEFGMLRHLGLTRAEVGRMIALEGTLTACCGVLVGLVAGAGIAWILIEVVNRQSFHWSMDLHLPLAPLAGFALALVMLAALVARIAAARAMENSAVQAVKEDW
ncbi:ABC transporter permease [Azoarcus olearius]|uniref:ABC transporter permease n=1 Tax=Azoarcus sp. (strain BH72) TaxID=418699 RepID=UPI0008063DBA|nr:ABC transporter permease [Azoarcus olearius]ANQ85073.1 ABC transporter permease [Azoarcus olearius]